jgi:hypothetical protein
MEDIDEDQIFEELAKRWPDLYSKSDVQYYGVGPGWLNIIDTLCGLISNKVDNRKRLLKYEQEQVGENRSIERIEKYQNEIEEAIEELPTISQVKEKYGGLRFYVYGATEEVYNYIDFAEAMSMRTCEECGAPGEPRSDGWTKTLCDRHHRERDEERNGVA